MMRNDWNNTGGANGRAFTLVELLVVIAIIGVLVSMLLPAVQAAREAARATGCQNNIRNIALATLNYESSLQTFAPGLHQSGTQNGGLGAGAVSSCPTWKSRRFTINWESPTDD